MEPGLGLDVAAHSVQRLVGVDDDDALRPVDVGPVDEEAGRVVGRPDQPGLVQVVQALQVVQRHRAGLLGPAAHVEPVVAGLRRGAQVEDQVQAAVVLLRHPRVPLVQDLVLHRLDLAPKWPQGVSCERAMG